MNELELLREDLANARRLNAELQKSLQRCLRVTNQLTLQLETLVVAHIASDDRTIINILSAIASRYTAAAPELKAVH